VGVAGVCLAVVTDVEQPDPGGELRRDVDDVLASLQQSLGQWAAGAVAALNRPDPLRPGLRVDPHRGIPDPVGSEPAGAEQSLVSVDDLDGGRESVGIDPDDHLRHSVLLIHLVPIGTARWAVLLRAGQSPFEPRLVTVPDGLQTGREPHPNWVGSRMKSLPPDTCTESG
jgi:hypothetical protein